MNNELSTSELAVKKIVELANSVAPNRKKEDEIRPPDAEIVRLEFKHIEELGPGAERGIALAIRRRENSIGLLMQMIGEPALRYVEYALREAEAESDEYVDRGDYERIVAVLSTMGEPAYPLLQSILWGKRGRDNMETARSQAARSLLEAPNGIEIISKALNDQDARVRIAVIGALYWEINANRFSNHKSELPKTYIPLFNTLKTRCLTDSDPHFRARAISTLSQANMLSTELLNGALDDSNETVRQEAARHVLHHGVKDKPTSLLFVKMIEDSSRKISDQAIETLTKSDKMDLELIANTIIEDNIIRLSRKSETNFNPERVALALQSAIEANPRIYGLVLSRLVDLSFERPGDVQRRSILVARRLLPEEFLTLVNERAENEPQIAAKILQLLGRNSDPRTVADQLSETEPGDIQGIAATQIKLLDGYYKDVLSQSNTSFRWAIGVTVLSLIALFITIFVLASQSLNVVSLITSISSIIAQFIAGTQLFLYKQTQSQLAYFHQQLNQTERFLLANSVCESLEGEAKQQARTELVKLIATFEIANTANPDSQRIP